MVDKQVVIVVSVLLVSVLGMAFLNHRLTGNIIGGSSSSLEISDKYFAINELDVSGENGTSENKSEEVNNGTQNIGE